MDVVSSEIGLSLDLRRNLSTVDDEEQKGNQGNHTKDNEIRDWKRFASDQVPETGCFFASPVSYISVWCACVA
jgi:hypothetical protein